MDLFAIIRERRSCRSFLPDPLDETLVAQVLEAGRWAPSPLNAQPWHFVVISAKNVKDRIHAEAQRCRQWAIEKSGWKWLGKYRLDFLQSAPTLIAVLGDPRKTGVDMFMPDGSTGYQHACAAAVQNMQLAAHALGLGSLWFTLFDKAALREILAIDADLMPQALVCLGRPADDMPPVPRKAIEKLTTYLR